MGKAGQDSGWPGGMEAREEEQTDSGALDHGHESPGARQPGCESLPPTGTSVCLTTLCLSVLVGLGRGNNPPAYQMCRAQSWSGKGLPHLIRPQAPTASPWCLPPWSAETTRRHGSDARAAVKDTRAPLTGLVPEGSIISGTGGSLSLGGTLPQSTFWLTVTL